MNRRLGFLDVTFEDGVFRGGILVTDTISVPIEVRWAKPVEPTPSHRYAYGSTLNRYVAIDCFAIPLLRNLEKKPELILIRREYLLDLRLHIEAPVLLVNTYTGRNDGLSHSETCPGSDASPGLRFTAHKRFEEDLTHVPELQSIFSLFDPAEVFNRLPIFLKAQER